MQLVDDANPLPHRFVDQGIEHAGRSNRRRQARSTSTHVPSSLTASRRASAPSNCAIASRTVVTTLVASSVVKRRRAVRVSASSRSCSSAKAAVRSTSPVMSRSVEIQCVTTPSALRTGCSET